jgi:hypothetical protein
MQLKTSLASGDYAAFRRFAMFRLRKAWLLYIPLMIFVGWTTYPRGANVPLVAGLVGSVLVALVVTLIALLLSLVAVALLPNRPGTVLGEHVYTLTDAGFQEQNEAGSSTIRWDCLRRFETSKHIFLLTPTQVGYIIPKLALASAPEFAKALAERTRQG